MRKGRQEISIASRDLLAKLKGKKEMHRQWKQGQLSEKE